MNAPVCTYQKPITRNVGFVYRPYYDYFDSTPYFESIYVSKHESDDHVCADKLKLNDGTLIEKFEGNYTNYIPFILLFCLVIYIWKNK